MENATKTSHISKGIVPRIMIKSDIDFTALAPFIKILP